MHQTTRRLTALQQRFVAAYLRNGQAVAAARQAGYSAATATHSSGRLMRAPHIRAAIADGRARQERHGDRLRDRVVRELERIAFDAPDDATQRPLDRLRALDLLGRMAERDLRRDSRRDPQRDQGADTASVDATTPPQPPAWEEQFRRGMERVERGRCKDAERARLKEADDVSKQAETTVSLDVPAAHANPQEKIGTEKNEAGEGTGEPEASEGKNAEEEEEEEEADWRRRRAYLSRCYPLTHWPEEAAFYERMGRFAPT